VKLQPVELTEVLVKEAHALGHHGLRLPPGLLRQRQPPERSHDLAAVALVAVVEVQPAAVAEADQLVVQLLELRVPPVDLELLGRAHGPAPGGGGHGAHVDGNPGAGAAEPRRRVVCV
jgi:hypothetical protein